MPSPEALDHPPALTRGSSLSEAALHRSATRGLETGPTRARRGEVADCGHWLVARTYTDLHGSVTGQAGGAIGPSSTRASCLSCGLPCKWSRKGSGAHKGREKMPDGLEVSRRGVRPDMWRDFGFPSVCLLMENDASPTAASWPALAVETRSGKEARHGDLEKYAAVDMTPLVESLCSRSATCRRAEHTPR